jgi:SAM-dependent methyltransferase
MTLSEKKSYYGKDLEAMAFAQNYHQWIFDAFSPYLGDVAAEVGAGTGNFSRLIVNSPVKRFVAFEPSENMYPLLVDRFRNDARIEIINDFLCNGYEKLTSVLDAILYVDVLEHIEEDEKELAIAWQTLKPGGNLLVFVPALPWLYSELDRKIGHYRRYRKEGLISLVRASGFEPVKVKFFDFLGIIPWYIFYVLLKKNITGNNVALYDRFIVPVMRKIESTLDPPVGKNLLLIARKVLHRNP